MMSDKEFAELELRATICPGQCEWPKPENIVWQKLHAVPNEAREHVQEGDLRSVMLALVAAGLSLAQGAPASTACVVLAGTADGFDKETAVSRAQRSLEDYIQQYKAENHLGAVTVSAMDQRDDFAFLSGRSLGTVASLTSGALR